MISNAVIAVILALSIAVPTLFFGGDLTREELSEYLSEDSRFMPLPMGAEVHYRDQGNADGPTIVLIHGGYGSLHNWEVWQPYLEDYRVISMDLPAHGLTGRIQGDLYTRDVMVQLVNELVTELGVKEFTVGGHSMGGGVALAYALKYPQQVTSLVLVGPEGIPPEGGYDFGGVFFEDEIDREGVKNDKSLSFGESLMIKFSSPWVVKLALQSMFANPDDVTAEMVQRYGRILRYTGNRYATTLMFRQTPAALDLENDLIPFLGDIHQPVLLMYGEEDTLVPATVGERAQKLLPNSRLKVYPDVGHMIQMEATQQTAADLLEFLSALQMEKVQES